MKFAEIDDVPLTSLYHQIVPINLDAIICRCYILCINSAYRVQSANFHPNQAEKYTGCLSLRIQIYYSLSNVTNNRSGINGFSDPTGINQFLIWAQLLFP